MKANIAVFTMILGYALLALAFITGLGYGLYLMGVAGMAFGPAAWGGFVLWLKMFVGGIVALISGFIIGEYVK